MICQNLDCTKTLNQGKKYCSVLCANRSVKRPIKKWKVCCKQCLSEFEVDSQSKEKVFCNQSCSAKYNNARRIRKTPPSLCLECQTPVKGRVKFCDSVCRANYKINLWLSGDWDATTKAGLSSTVRRYLLEKAGYRCSSPDCSVPGGWSGFNPVSGKSTLTVDHIDGDSSNNLKTNLRVLCPNCHSLTDTYGALNKGNGRSSRYESSIRDSNS